MNNLQIVKAEKEHTEVLLQILDDATKYKLAHGDKSWGDTSWQKSEIIENLSKGNQFLVNKEGHIIGSFVLLSACHLWDDDSSDAYYLKRIAIAVEHHGQGYGSQILSMLEDLCQKDSKDYLRLDCTASNKRLVAYYESQGFELAKEVPSHDNRRIALLQKLI